jgi:hypothetical protein
MAAQATLARLITGVVGVPAVTPPSVEESVPTNPWSSFTVAISDPDKMERSASVAV